MFAIADEENESSEEIPPDPALVTNTTNIDSLDQPIVKIYRYAFFLADTSDYFKQDYEAGPLLFFSEGVSENRAALAYIDKFYKEKKRLPIWFTGKHAEFKCLPLLGNTTLTSPGSHIEFKIFRDQIIKEEANHE